MKTAMSSMYNRQKVQFKRGIYDSVFIAKADGECFGDVIGDVTVNSEIGYMTVRLYESGKAKAELTLYKPYKDRPARIDHFLTNNGYVLA